MLSSGRSGQLPLQPLRAQELDTAQGLQLKERAAIAMCAEHAVPAGHALPSVPEPAVQQAADVRSPFAVDVCCNALYGDATAACSPDSSGHCQTPMSRLCVQTTDDTKENLKPESHVPAFEQRLNHCLRQSNGHTCKHQHPSRQLSQQPSQPSGDMLSQQPSQPAPDVCLIGSPPRSQQACVRKLQPCNTADTDCIRMHSHTQMAAPVQHRHGTAKTDCAAMRGQASAEKGGPNLDDADGVAELEFRQMLEAAQQQRVSTLFHSLLKVLDT